MKTCLTEGRKHFGDGDMFGNGAGNGTGYGADCGWPQGNGTGMGFGLRDGDGEGASQDYMARNRPDARNRIYVHGVFLPRDTHITQGETMRDDAVLALCNPWRIP